MVECLQIIFLRVDLIHSWAICIHAFSPAKSISCSFLNAELINFSVQRTPRNPQFFCCKALIVMNLH